MIHSHLGKVHQQMNTKMEQNQQVLSKSSKEIVINVYNMCSLEAQNQQTVLNLDQVQMVS